MLFYFKLYLIIIMKKTLILLTILSISLIFCSCVSQHKQSLEEQVSINSFRPYHEEDPTYGRYNLYSYNLYKHSIEIVALNADIAIYHAEIFDTNKDGIYDSVWVTQKGVVQFGSVIRHKFLNQTAPISIVHDFIGLGHIIKKYDREKRNADRLRSPYENIFQKTDVRLQMMNSIF